MSNTFITIFKKVQDVTTTLSGLALLFLVIVILLQTFTRFVVFYSLPWSEELSRYLFVIMILLGFNIAITRNELIKIDIIDSYLKGRSKMILQCVRLFLALFVNIIYIYSSFYLVRLGQFQLSPAMQIPMCIIYLFIFVGFVLSAISLIIEILSIPNQSLIEE